MANWINIEEGRYVVDEAFLLTPGFAAAPIEDAMLEVYLDGSNERRARGSGMAVSMLIVELLEDHDDIDLILDLGDEFKYYVKAPLLRAGKALAPDVKSLLQFTPRGPLEKLGSVEYARIRSKLSLVGS